MKAFFKYFLILVLFSCNGEKEILSTFSPETIILKPEQILDEFGEGVFFTRTTISADNERIFVANINPASLYILDKEFNLLKTIEDRGDGPGALLSPVQLFPSEDGLMVEDRGNYRVSIFQPGSGEYLEQIKIPDAVSTWRFFFQEGEFYFPLKGYQSDSLSVIKVNTSGEPLGKVGKFMPQNPNDFNRQARMIQPFDQGRLMLIGVNLPYIDIISSNGETLASHRWDQFEPLKRALDSLENDFKKPGYEIGEKEIKHIIIDAQYTGDKLYISFTDRIGLDRTKARNLLEFNISLDEFYLNRIFKFDTGSPDDNFHPYTFFVDKNAGKIYTQGLITQQIYTYNLPNEN